MKAKKIVAWTMIAVIGVLFLLVILVEGSRALVRRGITPELPTPQLMHYEPSQASRDVQEALLEEDRKQIQVEREEFDRAILEENRSRRPPVPQADTTGP